MKTTIKNSTLIVVSLLIGLFLGKVFFQSTTDSSEIDHSQHNQQKEEVWTCSMHPQIRQNEPGECPICGMDLIPVDQVGDNPLNLEMSEAAIRLANIQTAIVEQAKPEKELYMQGKVKADERKVAVITSRFAGRIEKLYVDFTGVKVSKGQKLASIYSPALITAQQELFEAVKYKDSNPALYQAARNKLKLWNINELQIDEIETLGKPKQEIDIVSPLSGIISKRMATLGEYIKEGTMLFEVIDLSKVWVVFDAYESDLPWLNEGDEINFSVAGSKGENYQTKVLFIDPLINAKTRTASVRVDVVNKGEKLKPEMFAQGRVLAKLPIETNKIIAPKSAVMWTGKRAILYVKLPDMAQPTFQFREVSLGLDLGSHYIIEKGLEVGEEIVVNGTFKVDAAAQLAGKNSMMNQQTGSYQAEYHVTEGFKQELTLFYHQYIVLKNALVGSNKIEATSAAKELLVKLNGFNMTELHDEAHDIWMEKASKIKNAIENLIQANKIDEQRTWFKPLSEELVIIVEGFGLHGVKVYKDFCPMAVKDKGAFWLSETEEIRNPYFGNKMLKCGEVKNVIDTSIKSEKAKPKEGHNH